MNGHYEVKVAQQREEDESCRVLDSRSSVSKIDAQQTSRGELGRRLRKKSRGWGGKINMHRIG